MSLVSAKIISGAFRLRDWSVVRHRERERERERKDFNTFKTCQFFFFFFFNLEEIYVYMIERTSIVSRLFLFFFRRHNNDNIFYDECIITLPPGAEISDCKASSMSW